MPDEPNHVRRALGERPTRLLERRHALDQPLERVRLLVDLGAKEVAVQRDSTAAGGDPSSAGGSASATWQAARRRGPSSRSNGVTVSHVAIA